MNSQHRHSKYLSAKQFVRINIGVLASSYILSSADCWAGAHTTQFEFSSSASHSNNADYSATSNNSLNTYIFRPSLNYSYLTEKTAGGIQLSSAWYRHSQTERDTENYYIDLFQSANSVTGSSSIRAFANRAATREASVEETGPLTYKPVVTIGGNLSFSKAISERWQMSSELSHLKKTYDSTLYADYDNSRLSLNFQHSLNEHFSPQFALSASRYQSQNSYDLDELFGNTQRVVTNLSDSYSLQLGFLGQWSEQLSYSVLLGQVAFDGLQKNYIQSRFDNGGTYIPSEADLKTEDHSNSAALSLTYKGQSYESNFSFNKQIQSTGNGVEYDSEVARGEFSGRLSERLSYRIYSLASKQTSLGSSLPQFSRRDRKYYETGLGASYQMNRDWTIRSSLKHSLQKYQGSSNSNDVTSIARATLAVIELSYSPDVSFH